MFKRPPYRLLSRESSSPWSRYNGLEGRWTIQSRDRDRTFVLNPDVARANISWIWTFRHQTLYLLSRPLIAWNRYWREFRATVRQESR
jgi:hypothetical protein